MPTCRNTRGPGRATPRWQCSTQQEAPEGEPPGRLLARPVGSPLPRHRGTSTVSTVGGYTDVAVREAYLVLRICHESETLCGCVPGERERQAIPLSAIPKSTLIAARVTCGHAASPHAAFWIIPGATRARSEFTRDRSCVGESETPSRVLRWRVRGASRAPVVESAATRACTYETRSWPRAR